MEEKKIEREIKEMLIPGEEILFVARQSRIRPGGSIFTPNSLYITTRRVIYRDPKLFGLKADISDFDYRDISNIRMKQGIFSTGIFLKSRFMSDDIRIPAVNKEDAKNASVTIQRGIRRELPNQIIEGGKFTPAEEPNKGQDSVEQLEKLGKLRSMGVISEDEFKAKKEVLLARI